MKHLFIILICAMAGFACKNQAPVTPPSQATEITVDEPRNQPTLRDVILDSTIDLSTIPTNYAIQHVEIKNGELYLTIHYSGGCKEHEFALITNMSFFKTSPETFGFKLQHINNDDACRELIQTTLRFKLDHLPFPKTAYLHIDGWKTDLLYSK